jgi:hypothetical protein
MYRGYSLTAQSSFKVLAPDGTLIDDVLLHIERHKTARRYILRVPDAKHVRVTIPRYGSVSAALAFADKQRAWIAQQLAQRRAAEALQQRVNKTHIMYHGELWPLQIEASSRSPTVCIGDRSITIQGAIENFNALLDRSLMALARIELPQRTHELSQMHKIPVARISVRNQRSRWGSCSRNRNISLNWRLNQLPTFVSDYVIVHELMHCLEMNHSRRFWQLVEDAYPDFSRARYWLRNHTLASHHLYAAQDPQDWHNASNFADKQQDD